MTLPALSKSQSEILTPILQSNLFLNLFLNNEWNALIKHMSTTQTFRAIIVATAVKLQTLGDETCCVHVKVDDVSHGNISLPHRRF